MVGGHYIAQHHEFRGSWQNALLGQRGVFLLSTYCVLDTLRVACDLIIMTILPAGILDPPPSILQIDSSES